MTKRTIYLTIPFMILVASCGGPEKPPSPECLPGEECLGEAGMTTGQVEEVVDAESPLEASVSDTTARTELESPR